MIVGAVCGLKVVQMQCTYFVEGWLDSWSLGFVCRCCLMVLLCCVGC